MLLGAWPGSAPISGHAPGGPSTARYAARTTAPARREPMARRIRIVIITTLLVCSACTTGARRDPSPSPIPGGTSPRKAILGRDPTDTDCFTTAYDVVEVPDPLTLERHVVSALHRPAWVPQHGFLGTPAELAGALHGQLIPTDPQNVWVLVPGDPHPRADRYFPLTARSGERVWYRDGSVQACA